MNNSPVKSELYVALEMVELTQFLPFTKINIAQSFIEFSNKLVKKYPQGYVLLIDEYNTPLNHLIGDSKTFDKIRNDLHYLYANIKQSKIS